MLKGRFEKMKKINWILFLIVLFGGWFGLDKLYMKNTKFFLYKLLSTLVVLGVIWNLYDLVCVLLNKYQVNPFNQKCCK